MPMTLLQRLALRNTDGDPWSWYSRFEHPFWCVQASTCWTHIALGPRWEREFGGGPYPDWWQLAIDVGPWSVALRREKAGPEF
jgi:hypothetical protein